MNESPLDLWVVAACCYYAAGYGMMLILFAAWTVEFPDRWAEVPPLAKCLFLSGWFLASSFLAILWPALTTAYLIGTSKNDDWPDDDDGEGKGAPSGDPWRRQYQNN
jgi:hypothetical protein